MADKYLCRLEIPENSAPSFSNVLELPDVVLTAFNVIAGDYGNGEERKKKLTKKGYNAGRVQNCVNDIYALIAKYKG